MQTVFCLPVISLYDGDFCAGGLVWISGWNSLQHATNAAFLAVVYSDYMLTSQTAAVQCSGKYYSPTDIRNFAISQVNYRKPCKILKFQFAMLKFNKKHHKTFLVFTCLPFFVTSHRHIVTHCLPLWLNYIL